LRGLAHAAIDVSDGLLADLGHILDASRCAARLCIPALPPAGAARDAYLAGGDDYELLFTAPAAQDARIAALAEQLALPLTRLGEIVAATPALPAGALVLHDEHGVDITPVRRGFEHFVDT
jgi:thiamine-monophosphate kinase